MTRANAPAGAALAPLPSELPATRKALHRVAESIVAPARKPDNEIALEATPGGFGTPPFKFAGGERQVRVDRDELVYRVSGEERRTRLTTLADAGALVADLLPDGTALDHAPLRIDVAAADVLAGWYALGAAVLADLIAEAGPSDAPSPIHLWPEHFDIAIELGSDAAGSRANYGFSPGDEDHGEPYVYVGPWTAQVEGELWRANGFRGAELTYSDLSAADSPRAAALDFCRTRHRALAQSDRA